MRKLKLFMMAILATVVFGGMSSVAAAAGTGTISNSTPNHSLTIERKVQGVSNPVTNTFTYKITPADTYEGVTGVPTSATVAFSNTAPVSNIATATGTIDLTNAQFTKNGDYVYTVTEDTTGDPTNYPKDSTNHNYTFKISVRNSASSGLTSDQPKVVTIYGFEGAQKIGDSTGSPAYTNVKYEFSASAQYKHIKISKQVTGNMADVDEYFTVSVTVGGTGTYAVTGSHNGTTSITAGTATNLTLKHGETITIGSNNNVDQIPVNTTYSFEETGASNYTTTINSAAQPSKTSGPLTVKNDNSQNENTIVNYYEESTVTGVFLRILPYVVIAAIAIAGVVYMIVRNKKQKEAEE